MLAFLNMHIMQNEFIHLIRFVPLVRWLAISGDISH